MIAPFKIDLDVRLVYQPPMDDNSAGIVITRTIELPFVPFNGLRVFSRTWEEGPEPYGLDLREVIWDMDRSVFLAKSRHTSVDLPVAYIPHEIRDWLGRGWRWGSYEERYEDEDASIEPAVPTVGRLRDPIKGVGDDIVEQLHTLPPEQRPKLFNDFLRALIRYMASSYTGLDTLYAMDQTQRYLGPGRVQSSDGAAIDKWNDLKRDYLRQTPDEHLAWMQKLHDYPDLGTIVLGDSARAVRQSGG